MVGKQPPPAPPMVGVDTPAEMALQAEKPKHRVVGKRSPPAQKLLGDFFGNGVKVTKSIHGKKNLHPRPNMFSVFTEDEGMEEDE